MAIQPRAHAGASDHEFDRDAGPVESNGNFALQGEFEGIGEQVEDDLFPHIRIDIERLIERRTIDHQRQPGPFAGRSEAAGQAGCEIRDVDRLEVCLRTPGLDARKVE